MRRERDAEGTAAFTSSGGGVREALERPRYVTLPIMLVLAVIGYVYYVTVFGVIEDWLGLTTASGLGNAATFSALVLMCLSTYVLAVFRDPGHVPRSFIPEIDDPQVAVHEIKRKGGDLRYCQKCSHYKPPRAHHCRVCKRCVLRMDHHCIWINNCVGHANYKFFFVFVLYTVIACIQSLALLLGFAYDVHKGQIQNGGSRKTLHIICGVLLFPLTLAVSILLGWHIYLIIQNKTTIEYYEGVRATWLAKKAGNFYEHPYDLGIFENLISTIFHITWITYRLISKVFSVNFRAVCSFFFYPAVEVLGPNIFCWLCPSSSHVGSGLRFPSSYDSRHETVPR